MTQPVRITGGAVVEFVAMRYGVSPEALAGPRRANPLTRARQFAMYAMRLLCPHLSYPAIGRLLGGRDHTTILHGCRKVEALIDQGEFKEDLAHLSEWFDRAYLASQIQETEQRLASLKAIQAQLLQVPA